MDVDRYLARIGCEGARTAVPETLARLQRAHLFRVPYENFDVFLRREHGLGVDELYEKIVVRRRGGYCFELNGLFAALLRALGFSVDEYFGRWLDDAVEPVPARRHRVLRVSCADGSAYLADVGVGQRAPLRPLLYAEGLVQEREGVRYRIVRGGGRADANGAFPAELAEREISLEQEREPGAWVRLFSWDEAPQCAVDFEYAHYFLRHHPSSPFRGSFLVHLPCEGGRTLVFVRADPNRPGTDACFFASQRGGRSEVVRVASADALERILSDRFGVTLRFFPHERAALARLW